MFVYAYVQYTHTLYVYCMYVMMCVCVYIYVFIYVYGKHCMYVLTYNCTEYAAKYKSHMSQCTLYSILQYTSRHLYIVLLTYIYKHTHANAQ